MDGDLAVLDLVGRAHAQELEGPCERLPPNSAYMMSLRMRSPSKADPYETGIGTLAILTLTPRTSMQRWMSFSVRSMSSAPGISSKGMLTTCS